MTTFNVGGIWDAYLQGANFASQSLDRAEKAREEHKKKAAAEFGSRLYNLTTRVDPESGIPLFKNEQEIYNSPEFVDLLNNTELGREIINEGMPDNGYTAKIKRAIPVEGGGWAPEMGWYDDDGVEQSVGPMSIDPKTGKRSNSPDSKVIAPSLPGWLHVGLSKLGEYDLGYADRISNNIKEAGVNSSLAQLRGLPEDQRGPVVDKLIQLGVPSERIVNSMTVGLPVTKQNADGTVTEIKPGGSTTLRRDPELFKNVTQPTYDAETGLMVSRKGSLADADLSIRENQSARTNQLEVTEAKARALADLEFKETFGPRIRELAAQQQRSTAEVEEELRAKYFPEMVKRKVTEIGATVQATAGANYEAAPTNKKTHDVLNPVPAQDEKNLLQAREVLNPSAVPTLLSKGEAVADQTVLDWAPKLTTNDLQGLYAGLARAYQNGNPAAAKPLESVRRILHDAAADKTEGGRSGKAPAAPVFKKDELKGYLKDRVPDEVADSAALNGEVKFRKAVDTLGALGLPIPKDSVGSAIVNRVVGNEFILQHNGVLSDSGVDDAFPALWSWEAVARETNPNDAEDPAKAQAYVRDVFIPITQELKASGLPSTFEKSHAVALDVARLQKVGLGEKDAIREAIKLEKDPKYAEEVLAASRRDKKPAYEIVKEWSKKDVRSLSSADLSGKRQTLSSPAMRGFSTLYPELNPR